jgi:hypothetical protein
MTGRARHLWSDGLHQAGDKKNPMFPANNPKG